MHSSSFCMHIMFTLLYETDDAKKKTLTKYIKKKNVWWNESISNTQLY